MKDDNFKYILRVFNTNLDGKQKVPFALRKIKGVGRRFAKMITYSANIDANKRAGELTDAEVEKIIDVVNKPLEYGLPEWVVNRKKDPKDGTYTQQVSNGWDTKIREDLEKMKKIRLHKGLRHYFGIKVRGQHTNSTGRRGKTVGVSRTKGK